MEYSVWVWRWTKLNSQPVDDLVPVDTLWTSYRPVILTLLLHEDQGRFRNRRVKEQGDHRVEVRRVARVVDDDGHGVAPPQRVLEAEDEGADQGRAGEPPHY